jgi:hypothetical protein
VKVGDLVRYRGWANLSGPLGMIVEEAATDNSFHHRIRVMWVGDPLPTQANALSIHGKRITSWVTPKHFEKV